MCGGRVFVGGPGTRGGASAGGPGARRAIGSGTAWTAVVGDVVGGGRAALGSPKF
jgi:hypothetical protein